MQEVVLHVALFCVGVVLPHELYMEREGYYVAAGGTQVLNADSCRPKGGHWAIVAVEAFLSCCSCCTGFLSQIFFGKGLFPVQIATWLP